MTKRKKQAIRKYQELVLLLLGFLLTTVIGGYLGAKFQERSWNHQHQVQAYESERETATKGFDNLSDLMDRRLLRMRQLAWKLEEAKNLGDVEEERKKNKEARDEWSMQLNRNLAFTQRYFGDQARSVLENEVSNGFTRIHAGFNEVIKSGKLDRAAFQKLGDDIDKFNPTIYAFDLSLMQAIQDGKVGRCSITAEK